MKLFKYFEVCRRLTEYKFENKRLTDQKNKLIEEKSDLQYLCDSFEREMARHKNIYGGVSVEDFLRERAKKAENSVFELSKENRRLKKELTDTEYKLICLMKNIKI